MFFSIFYLYFYGHYNVTAFVGLLNQEDKKSYITCVFKNSEYPRVLEYTQLPIKQPAIL